MSGCDIKTFAKLSSEVALKRKKKRQRKPAFSNQTRVHTKGVDFGLHRGGKKHQRAAE